MEGCWIVRFKNGEGWPEERLRQWKSSIRNSKLFT
jgi:hypothetical protein